MSAGGTTLNFRIEYSDKAIRTQLERLRRDFSDNSNFVRDTLKMVGSIYKEETLKCFENESDPKGNPWAPLTKTTIRHKSKGRDWGDWPKGIAAQPSRIGKWDGDLIKGIRFRTVGNTVVVGSNIVWAKQFHEGAKKGQYGKFRSSLSTGKTKKGLGKLLSSPWGRVPARPFLGINKEANARILKLLMSRLTYHKA